VQTKSISDTPMEFMVDFLTKAIEIADGNANIPEELRVNLQKALDIACDLDGYLEKMSSQESAPLAELYQKTMEHNWEKVVEEGKTQFRLPKECVTSQGQTLNVLVHMSKAKTILEIGMFTGYGSLSMAGGLPEDGSLVACELQPYLKEFAQPIFDKSPHDRKITVKIGSAMDTLKELAAAAEQFDMVFVDADKNNYMNYYKFILDHNLLRLSGVICVNNSLFKPKVYLKDTSDENGFGIFSCVNEEVFVFKVILPLRDGISIIRRVPMAPACAGTQVTYNAIFRGVNGRVAYVTGAGQGIGRVFAHALGEAGAKVAVVDLDQGKAEGVAEELTLKDKGINCIAITADIGKSVNVERMIDSIVSKWGEIQIACNNAGVHMDSASEDTSNVMLKQGYGKIIDTASMASLIVSHPQKQLAYNTSKAGVLKLTQTLGTEWIDRGVRVNCISPGIVDTSLIHSESLRPLVQRWLSDIPAGRLALVTDLQAAVVYLASDASDYMTGHNLVIEGGQSLW
uniref:Zgc:113054 n=1 Tax=Salmo trutta TaxID=8032 RepID=A0A674C624_SALTR